MTTLQDIVNKTTWKELLDSFTLKTMERRSQNYFHTILKQLKYLSAEPNSMKIFITYTKDKTGDYLHVNGMNGEIDSYTGETAKWNISYMSWAEWLGMEIDESVLKRYSYYDILGACIYEMGWGGNSEYLIKESMHDLIKKPLVFISHASEDKDEVVRPLAQELEGLGIRIWYDEYELKIGDSLRKRISDAISKSAYGIVVFSKAFLSKTWTEHELVGLIAMELNKGSKLLPIWHNIGLTDILQYDPSLADKIALSTKSLTIEQLALKISERIRLDKRKLEKEKEAEED